MALILCTHYEDIVAVFKNTQKHLRVCVCVFLCFCVGTIFYLTLLTQFLNRPSNHPHPLSRLIRIPSNLLLNQTFIVIVSLSFVLLCTRVHRRRKNPELFLKRTNRKIDDFDYEDKWTLLLEKRILLNTLAIEIIIIRSCLWTIVIYEFGSIRTDVLICFHFSPDFYSLNI